MPTRIFIGVTAALAICWVALSVGSILDPPAIWHVQAKVASALKIHS